MGTITYDYSDETVLVTGASSGIGRAIALRFGDAGATVINADIEATPKDVDADDPTHEVIRSSGGDAQYIETDVSKPNEFRSVVDAARDFGGVDILVNNAALHLGGSFTDITPEEFDRIHDVNVRSVFFATQAVARDLIHRGEVGSIVNIASISSTEVQPENAIYESTKAAVKMITRSTAFSLAESDIRVNAVAPGHTVTEFIEGLSERQREKERNDGFLKPIPLGRVADSEDIPGAVLFLASDDADYITGEVVHVDGGWQVL